MQHVSPPGEMRKIMERVDPMLCSGPNVNKEASHLEYLCRSLFRKLWTVLTGKFLLSVYHATFHCNLNYGVFLTLWA